MTQEKAHRRARLDLEGIEQTKEKCRDARRTNFIENFVQDLRFGLCMLRKSLGFTTVAGLTLALGIGANTAIFSVVNGVLLHSLPYAEPRQLVQLHETSTAWGPDGWSTASGPDFEDWHAQSRSFSGLAAAFGDGLNLTGGNEPQRIRALHVSLDFLSVLAAKPAQGRLLSDDDFKPGKLHGLDDRAEFPRRRFARPNASHCATRKYDLWLDPDVTTSRQFATFSNPAMQA